MPATQTGARLRLGGGETRPPARVDHAGYTHVDGPRHGAPAFDGDTPIATALKQIRELPKRPSEIIPDFPPRLEAIIMKCLRKDPARRYQSVNELAAALETEYAIRSSVSWPVALKQQIAQAGEQLRRNPSVAWVMAVSESDNGNV